MISDRLPTIVGFLAALVLLAALVWYVGIADVLSALARADTVALGLVVVAGAVWMAAWGLSLWTVMHAIGAPVRPLGAIFVFSAAMFSNNVTPFGQAGGEPISALLISSFSDSEYETGLAAIASVDTLHFVPSIGLATVGFGFILLSAAELTRNLVVAALAVAVLAVIVPLAAYVGWQHRPALAGLGTTVLTPLARGVGRAMPGRTPPSKTDVEQRIQGFFGSIERIAGNRRALVTAMAFSAIGWFSLSAALWLSLYALGYVVPFPAALLVVPVGSIAGVTPLPGGLGGLEAAFIALLVPAAGVSASVATAAVLIHRGATYWLPTIVGGMAAGVIGGRSRR